MSNYINLPVEGGGGGGGGGVTSLNGLTGALALIGSGITVTPGVSTITLTNAGLLSLTGMSPISVTAGQNPVVSIQQANASQSGYLSAADWVTFNSKGSGSVTSVALSAPAMFSVSGSPVTTSGTLAFSLVSQSANTFFAAPDGSAGVPTFRAIVPADVPTLNQNTTGTASNVTGVVTSAHGGTGLSATPTNGQIPIGNGSGYSLSTVTAGAGIAVTNGPGSITITNTYLSGTINLDGGQPDSVYGGISPIDGGTP